MQKHSFTVLSDALHNCAIKTCVKRVHVQLQTINRVMTIHGRRPSADKCGATRWQLDETAVRICYVNGITIVQDILHSLLWTHNVSRTCHYLTIHTIAACCDGASIMIQQQQWEQSIYQDKTECKEKPPNLSWCIHFRKLNFLWTVLGLE